MSQNTPFGPPPQTAENPTQPLWFGDTSTQQLPPTAPGRRTAYGAFPLPAEPQPPVSEPVAVEHAQPARPRRRIAELTAVAVLAAALSSGGTYVLTRGDARTPAAPAAATGSTQTTSVPKVVQAAANAPDWTATAAAVSPSVVAITVASDLEGGQGSGVVLDTAGHIVTNNHVVSGAGTNPTITVTLSDSRTYPATIVGTDPTTDLAVIKLTGGPDDLTPISLGDDSTLKVGDPVMAVGNPLGLAGTVTTGIVSALNRPVTTSAQQQPTDPFGRQTASAETVVTNAVQTSAAINPGNSGGALVDANGRLVGINSSIAQLSSSSGSSQSGNIGIGFAIPVNEVSSITQQLISTGKAEHAYLGVSSQDATVKDGSASRAAAKLTAVSPGTAAASAGLQVGDAIVAVGGEAVDGSLSLVAQIRERAVGEIVTLTIVRNGERQDLPVTLGRKPS